MKKIIPFVLLITTYTAVAGQGRRMPLNRDTTLVLWYSAIGCTCAQWGDGNSRYYYLVPANNKLVDADTLWDGVSFPLKVRVTGKLISYSGVPESYRSLKSVPDPGNVFRYTRIRLLYKGKPIMSQ